MSPVEFKKRPCRPVNCKGQGPQPGLGKGAVWRWRGRGGGGGAGGAGGGIEYEWLQQTCCQVLKPSPGLTSGHVYAR